MTPVIHTDGLSKRYRRKLALDDCTLSVPTGRIVGLVGPNGAGKSTLLAILAGALEPSEGTVERPARVGWVPQRPAHYGRLSALENLRLFAALERAPAARADELLELFELPSSTRAADLSVGNRQRLDVALALLASPEVLLLDEPTASLDPAQRARVWEIARGLAASGGGVLVATHHWEELEGKATRTLELVEGRLA